MGDPRAGYSMAGFASAATRRLPTRRCRHAPLQNRAKGIEDITGKRPKVVQDFRRMLDDKSVDATSWARPTTGMPWEPSSPSGR
jgi:hypothetical protein